VTGDGGYLAPADEREIVGDVTTEVLAEAAPEELELFLGDRESWLAGRRVSGAHEDMLGFGAEALVVLTPYVVAAVGAAVRYVVSVLAEGADEQVRPRIKAWVRHLFRLADPGPAATPAPLPADVAQRVHDVTLSTCVDMGLSDSDARLVSDAVVGRLLTAAT
jgi:hypothetical protein